MTLAVSVELGVDALLLAARHADVVMLPPVLAVFPRVFYPGEQSAVDTAVVSALTRAGVMDSAGRFHPAVLEWVSVLGHPQVQATARIRDGERVLRMSLARCDGDHVLALRLGERVTLQPIFGTGLHDTVTAALAGILGARAPRAFVPLTAPAAALEGLGELADTSAPLAELGAAPDTATIIAALAATTRRTAEVTMIAHTRAGARPVGAAVAVFDGPDGRVLARTRKGTDERRWTTFAPGTPAQLRQGVADLAALLPGRAWHGDRTRP